MDLIRFVSMAGQWQGACMRLQSHLRPVMGLIFSIDSIATGMEAVDGEGIGFNRKWLKCS